MVSLVRARKGEDSRISLLDKSLLSGFGILLLVNVADDRRHKTTFDRIAMPSFVDLESMGFFGDGCVLFSCVWNFEHCQKSENEAKNRDVRVSK